MHEVHEKAKRAHEILKACEINIGADFEALGAAQVGALVAHADQHRLKKYGPMSKYRQSPSVSSSLVRSFHELLQRRAAFRIARRRSWVLSSVVITQQPPKIIAIYAEAALKVSVKSWATCKVRTLTSPGRLVTVRAPHDFALACSRFISSSLPLRRFSGGTETLPEQKRAGNGGRFTLKRGVEAVSGSENTVVSNISLRPRSGAGSSSWPATTLRLSSRNIGRIRTPSSAGKRE
jgi:hypothetical protein